MLDVFPLASPPDLAGIYALKNHKTNQIYIGAAISLRQRCATWRSSRLHSGPIIEALKTTELDDWFFHILQVCPGLGVEALHKLELAVIKRAARTIPGLLLNVNGGVPELLPNPKYVVYNDDNEPIRYKDAAVALNISYGTITARIASLERKGFTKITLHDLRQRGIYSITGARPTEV